MIDRLGLIVMEHQVEQYYGYPIGSFGEEFVNENPPDWEAYQRRYGIPCPEEQACMRYWRCNL